MCCPAAGEETIFVQPPSLKFIRRLAMAGVTAKQSDIHLLIRSVFGRWQHMLLSYLVLQSWCKWYLQSTVGHVFCSIAADVLDAAAYASQCERR